MQITAVSTRRYRSDPLAVGGPEIQIVEVHTDEGIVGTGFASASAASGEALAALLRDVLGPAVIGADPVLNVDLWHRMYAQALPRRAGDGLGRVAISAIDFALWDIKGKRAGLPVSSLLGGRRERVPTYANCAHHMEPDALAERAAEYVARGHRALKIRGSRTFVSLSVATERVRRVREAIGPDIRLMVDVNGTWDVDTAIAQLRAWEPFDVYWLEEPVPPHDVPGYARIRERAGRTLIAGGEQHVGLGEFRELIERRAVDVLQPNAALTGGITDWLTIHGFATAHGVPISPWNLQPVHLHMAAGLANVQWIEYFMPDNALLEFQTRLFSAPAMREEVTDEGVFLLAPEAVGLGLALDPEMAERSLVSE